MNPGARLVVLGKQGAGKGTQAVRLSRHYVVPHVSTGDTFRAAVRSGSEFGEKARQYLDAGELVPDEIVIGMVRERLTRGDTTNRGFILDGFPRTVHQAEALSELLEPRQLDLVIDLEVDTEQVLTRLAGRRVCSDCGANYSVVDNPPRVNEICDVCGGEVVQRDDDTEAAIRRRLELYERETAPLVHWYKSRGLLAVVDGSGSPDQVTGRVIDEIDRRRDFANVVDGS
ncbi:MAG TPA: adenylate kinase [Acidimicrobiales bacterium]